MHAVISPVRIDIYKASALPNEKWESLLNELKAEHVPGSTPIGKRMAAAVNADGGMTAFIYRTSDLRDDEIVKILQQYGISTD
jgi:hypothetical protein